tara:strand:- start:2314 stop:2598 length:285 start_codon:yes stop_codon:yes gene_type:complete
MKATIYTEVKSQEEWSLNKKDVEKLIKYLKSEQSWDDTFKDFDSQIEIIWELENNPDKYANEIRSWLYNNLHEPYKEWCGEEGNVFDFYSYKKD